MGWKIGPIKIKNPFSQGKRDAADAAAKVRLEEEERERKLQEATRAINAIFGVGAELVDRPAISPNANVPGNTSVGRALQHALTIDGPRYAVTDPDLYGGDPELIVKAQQSAAERARLYDTTAQDIINYFREDLDRDLSEEQRQARFSLARSGLSGSGRDASMNARLLERYNRGLLQAGNVADASVTDMRGLDEQSRMNLINQILAGGDASSAISGATAAMQNNVERARSAAMTQSLGNIFGDMRELYNLGQQRSGRDAAQQQFQRSGAYYNPQSYTGNVVRR